MTDSDNRGKRVPDNPDPPSSPALAPAARGPSLINRIKSLLTLRTVSLRDDLQVALDDKDRSDSSDFSESERAILQNVLKLSAVSIDDIMVERSDIQAVSADINLGALIARFRQVGHSRLHVYENDLDNIVGFIHIKDALAKITAPLSDPDKEVPVKLLTAALRQKVGKLGITRTAMFVPSFMPAGDLLQSMRASRTHMAIVVDEYGGTDGLVTIEDLLEAIVGQIEDEHDEAVRAMVRKISDDTYIANARAELEEVQAVVGPDFDPGDHADDVDTIGGLVFDLAGHVPKRGEKVNGLEGFEFEILAADPRRIKRLRIRRKRDGETDELLAITDQRTDQQRLAAE
jgi:CBS domain containing-hemolysin-like protein